MPEVFNGFPLFLLGQKALSSVYMGSNRSVRSQVEQFKIQNGIDFVGGTIWARLAVQFGAAPVGLVLMQGLNVPVGYGSNPNETEWKLPRVNADLYNTLFSD